MSPQTLCRSGMPTITVRADHQYLVVRADAGPGICSSMQHTAANMRAPSVAKAPYPAFTPPDGATFMNVSKQTFSGNSHVASIGVVSTLAATTILSGLAQQMTAAGWQPKATLAAGGDSQAFTIRDKDGVDWIAALALVPINANEYIFTASAFKLTETNPSAVTAAR
jgi:hypothetical protein